MKGSELWRRVRRALVAILLAIAATFVLSRAGTLHGLERLALDWELAVSRQSSSDIVLVKITDADYSKQFQGKSPLDPQQLHDLISAIAVSQPLVIAVDIDTSHPQFRTMQLEKNWPKVIWERDKAPNHPAEEERIQPLDVLGGQDSKLNQGSGLPVLLDDPEDRTTRLYTRCVATQAGAGSSFAYAVANTYHSLKSQGQSGQAIDCKHQVDTQPLFIRFSLQQGSSLYEKDATQVLGLSGKQDNNAPGQSIPQFSQKIVLLGGTYGDCDRHFTPIGTLPGAIVLANAIQTEIDGGGAAAFPRWFLFVIEFVAGALLVLLFHWFPVPGKVMVWWFLIAVLMSLGLSLLLFHTFSRFVSFFPTLVAVVIFEIYEHLRQRSVLHIMEWKEPPPSKPGAQP